ALPLLAQIISNPAASPNQQLKFFRAFDFHKKGEKQKILLSLLEGHHPQQKDIDALTLLQLDAGTTQTAEVKNAIQKGLKSAEGTQLYVDLVRKYKIRNKNTELLELMKQNNNEATK